MQLTYRGISYQANTTNLATIEQKIDVKYRGVTYQRSQLKTKKVADICVLKYRGVESIKIISYWIDLFRDYPNKLQTHKFSQTKTA